MKWLATANAIGDGMATVKGAAPRGKPILTRQAEDAIEQALSLKDPSLAKRLVEKAMNKAVMKSKKKRTELLAYLKRAEGKDTRGSFLTGVPPTPKAPGPMAKAVGKAFTPTTKSPSAMGAEAYCTFDVFQIANYHGQLRRQHQ